MGWLPRQVEGDLQSIHIEAIFLFKPTVQLLKDKAIKMKTKNETLRTSAVGVKGTMCGGNCRNEKPQKDQSLDSLKRRDPAL